MAISLTTDGLRLDYRDTVQSSVSGTYPIGTAILTGVTLQGLPGTWLDSGSRGNRWPNIGSKVLGGDIGIRLE